MISAVVLTHNDERILARCLASLSWCNEIIVVDDYSQDKTEKIVKKFKAKIFKHQLADNFSQQRNFGLEQATGKWVLFVDSDEVVTPQLAREIKSRVNGENNGFYLRRQDIIWGRELRYGETTGIKLLRLARRVAGSWYGLVHETWQVQEPTADLSNPLWHYPHPNVAQFIEEINRYSSLRAWELSQSSVRTNLGQIIIYPLAKFFLNYFWRLGFLDGMPGAVMAIAMSFHSFLVRAKLYLLQINKK